jgi:hypothetical protein
MTPGLHGRDVESSDQSKRASSEKTTYLNPQNSTTQWTRFNQKRSEECQRRPLYHPSRAQRTVQILRQIFWEQALHARDRTSSRVHVHIRVCIRHRRLRPEPALPFPRAAVPVAFLGYFFFSSFAFTFVQVERRGGDLDEEFAANTKAITTRTIGLLRVGGGPSPISCAIGSGSSSPSAAWAALR